MLIDLNLGLNQPTQALAELDNFIAYLINAGMLKKALDFLINQVKENPKQPALQRRLGELYRQLGQNEAAIEQLDIAADHFTRAGNRTAAVEALVTLLTLNPPNAEYYQQLLARLQKEQ